MVAGFACQTTHALAFRTHHPSHGLARVDGVHIVAGLIVGADQPDSAIFQITHCARKVGHHDVWHGIRDGLQAAGYEYSDQYIVMRVPNIVDISYGRGVGYTFTEHDLGKEVHSISATKIRAEMREKGEL